MAFFIVFAFGLATLRLRSNYTVKVFAGTSQFCVSCCVIARTSYRWLLLHLFIKNKPVDLIA